MQITLANLGTASAQQVFDQVYLGLKSQDFKRSMNNNRCAYRGDNNRKCAGGWCLSDNDVEELNAKCARRYEADPDDADYISIEGQSWHMLADAQLVPQYHKELISALQSTHDSMDSETNMRAELKYAADRFRLGIPTDEGEAA